MQKNVEDDKNKKTRSDGYVNLMTKYGTQDDSSEHYRFESDDPVTDAELSINYDENGLFAKIIDIPAEDAVSSGFSYGLSDSEIEKFIDTSLDELDFGEKAETALKWTRLYGGALGVMFVDDGEDDLTTPLNWDNVRGIDDLLIYERPLVTPDYNSVYEKRGDGKRSKMGLPEFYNVSPIYGRPFRVHESRCLIFRNNIVPSLSTKTEYRFFGIPEYVRIHRELRDTLTAHGLGPKILDRAVQAVHKIKDLAEKMATEEGENEVLNRLNLVDMARGLFNTIAIDAEGEDYDFKSMSFAGVKDIMDSACNILSAVTTIPQTKLFGRSPAGENATGKGDMENYYNFVKRYQNLNLKPNLRTLIDIILLAGQRKGKFDDVPEYNLSFNPLWNLSDAEQASVDQTRAQTEMVKAQTAQIYVDMQVLDPSEVRNSLANSSVFTINDILDEEDADWSEEADAERVGLPGESEETSDTAITAQPTKSAPEGAASLKDKEQTDSEDATGCGVLIIKDGKILVGTRKDNGQTCGPGGHIENGETAEEAAARETREEFGVYVAELIPLAVISGMPEPYCPSQVFVCTEYYGNPVAINKEMKNARFETIREIKREPMFLPFARSLQALTEQLKKANTDSGNSDEWVTVNGQHVNVGENGQVISGNPKVMGEKAGSNNEGKGEQKKQNKNSEKQKKDLQQPQNGGKIYAGEKIKGFIESPKSLGDTTHKEKHDDFISHGAEVKPLSRGKQKGIPYESGGGYKVNGEEDGQYFQYHPETGSHHGGEYYKISSGKSGTKHYDMDGNEIT